MFLVTSDDPGKAKVFILNDQKASNDVFYVGTIESAVDGHMTKTNSTGTDLALLSMCDHMIISHGTYGMWGSLLGSNGETICPKDFAKTDVGKEVKSAHLSNWIFL